MSDFEGLYEMAMEEEEYLDDFRESISSAVSGYIATRLGDQLNGVPVYIGEAVSDEDIGEAVETAQDIMAFSEARVGQLAYASQELRSQNGFKHYNIEGENVKASQLADMFHDRIQSFKEAEEIIKYNLEVAQQQEDVPVDDVDLEAIREIPDFDIEDWQWPRENLWPF